MCSGYLFCAERVKQYVITLSFMLENLQFCKSVDMLSGDSNRLGLNEYHRLRTGHQATAEEKAPSFQLQGGCVVVANKLVSHKQPLVSPLCCNVLVSFDMPDFIV